MRIAKIYEVMLGKKGCQWRICATKDYKHTYIREEGLERSITENDERYMYVESNRVVELLSRR